MLLATVFVFGCCVLPFHGVMHRLMPVCDMAAHVMRGSDDDSDDHHDASQPARERQEQVKRTATWLPRSSASAGPALHATVVSTIASTAYRSFITLGAIRCDRDVGWHLLIETFRI
jgi:hypothetical protein